MSVKALFVKCADADALIDELPMSGLSGSKITDEIVRIDSSIGGTAELFADLEFELDWHADQLGIRGFKVADEDWKPVLEVGE